MNTPPGQPCTTAVCCCPLPAAAPGLLEALREFSTLFDQGYFENALTMPAGKRIVLGIKEKVERAIAHAEGRG